MRTRKKVTDLWTVTRNGPDILKYGYSRYTLGPAGCVAASHTLRNEGERPTGYTEAMAAAVASRATPTGLQRAISVANIDRKVTYFYRDSSVGFYIVNPMEINANPEKSDRPVDSHEEWAQNPALIREMVSRDVHFDLLVASRPLRRSETRANDPLGIPRRWRGRWACYAPPAALRRLALSTTSIGK